MSIEYLPEPKFQLLVATETNISIYRVKRGIHIENTLASHNGPILGMIEIDPVKIIKKPSKEPPKLISIAQDNKLIVWDVMDMMPQKVLEAPPHSEITSLGFL